MVESKDAYRIDMEGPGIKPDDIQVTIDQGVLTIRGERRSGQETRDRQYHRIERRYGSFRRSITLPSHVDADRVEASYDNGVLRLTAPKTEAVQPRRIVVQPRSQVEPAQSVPVTGRRRPGPPAPPAPSRPAHRARRPRLAALARPRASALHGAAALLRVSPAAVLREAREGRLPGRQIDEEWRFSRAHLLQWLGGEDGPAVTPQPASQSGEARAGQDLEGLAARTAGEPTPAERAALDENDALGER